MEQQTTIRLPSELLEQLKEQADKLGKTIEIAQTGEPFCKYSLRKGIHQIKMKFKEL